MNVAVSPEAAIELAEGARFYAKEADTDLGLAFIEEFERAIGGLSVHPLLGTVWRGTTRRFPLRRFPYTIIYQVQPDELRVIALAHQSRKPEYWSDRA